MSILCDKEIIELSKKDGMITPFHIKNVRYDHKGQKMISYGVSTIGYDVTLNSEKAVIFHDLSELFSNIEILKEIDPLAFDENNLKSLELLTCDKTGFKYFLMPPHSFMLGSTNEYFKMPEDIGAVCFGKSTYARCFTGDTKVALVDGTSPTFIELIDRVKSGERIFGYSLDENAQVSVTELISPRKIGTETIIEIEIDNGEVIRCTPDHKFLLRSGGFIEAKDLFINQSLMPLYRINSRGYESVYHPITGYMSSTHWLSDKWNVRHGVYSDSESNDNVHRHHLDHNKQNNVPSNISRVDASKHITEHNLERMLDLEWKKWWKLRLKEGINNAMKDPIWRAELVERSRNGANQFWRDEKHIEARERVLANMKTIGANLSIEERQKKADTARKYLCTEENLKRSSEHLKRLWLDDDFRKLKSEQTREINIRKDITKEALINALEIEGSIRGAARRLNCDRTTFRRFKDVVIEFKEKWDEKSIKLEDIHTALTIFGTIRAAANSLGVSASFIKRRKQLINEFYGGPIGENHKVVSIKNVSGVFDVYCLTAPEYGNFALEAGVFVKNCGIDIHVTPIEPGFIGNVVLEFSNETPLPVRIYADQGVCQFTFHKTTMRPEVTYADKQGKYQGQTGITLPKG